MIAFRRRDGIARGALVRKRDKGWCASEAASRLREVVVERAVVFAGDPVPNSGRPVAGEWLLDLRAVFLLPEALNLIAGTFWSRRPGPGPWQIVAPELGAVPLLGAILQKAFELGIDANGLVVRKSRNKNGLQRTIEGDIRDVPTIVIDDLVNSGESLERVRLALSEVGVVAGTAFVVVDFQEPTSVDWRRCHGVQVERLFTLKDLNLEKRRPRPRDTLPPDRFERVWEYRHDRLCGLRDVTARSSPVVADGRVFFGTSSGSFLSLAIDDGRIVWRHNIAPGVPKGIKSTPAIVGDAVYFGAYDGNVYALRRSDGCQIWTAYVAEFVGSSPVVAPGLGLLFVGLERETPNRHGALAALDLATGEPVWEVPMREYLHATPAYVAERSAVICGTNDKDVLSVDAITGKVLWRVEIGGQVKMAPAIDPTARVVWVGAMDGGLYALDLDSGATRSKTFADSAIYASPLLVDGRVFACATDKRLYVVESSSGKTIARLNSRARSFSSPALIDGGVVFGNNAGLLFDIDPRTLVLRARYQISDRIVSKVAHDPATGLYFVHTFEDRLIALRKVSAQGGAE